MTKNKPLSQTQKTALIVWVPIIGLILLYVIVYVIFMLVAQNEKNNYDVNRASCEKNYQLENQKALDKSHETGVYDRPLGCQDVPKNIKNGFLGLQFYD